MQAPIAERAPDDGANCEHRWKRVKEIEEDLNTVVFVRHCELCGRLEAKAGHKDRWDEMAGRSSPPEGRLQESEDGPASVLASSSAVLHPRRNPDSPVQVRWQAILAAS